MRGPLLIAIALAAGYVFFSGNAVSRHTVTGKGGGAGIESYMNASGRASGGVRNAAAGLFK
jgi:hypothetical protein